MSDEEKITDWREDFGLKCKSFYKRRMAILPVKCSDGSTVWLSTYYQKYETWYGHFEDEITSLGHTDFIENITEAEYLVRKLAESL